MKGCMRALVAQLKSESEDLQQVMSFEIKYFFDISIILHPVQSMKVLYFYSP